MNLRVYFVSDRKARVVLVKQWTSMSRYSKVRNRVGTWEDKQKVCDAALVKLTGNHLYTFSE